MGRFGSWGKTCGGPWGGLLAKCFQKKKAPAGQHPMVHFYSPILNDEHIFSPNVTNDKWPPDAGDRKHSDGLFSVFKRLKN